MIHPLTFLENFEDGTGVAAGTIYQNLKPSGSRRSDNQLTD